MQKNQGQAPYSTTRFEADISRALSEANRVFNPLHKDCEVSYRVFDQKNGFVVLQVALPSGMTRAFVALLESLHGLFRFMDNKARITALGSAPVDLSELEQQKQFQKNFQSKVCTLFDGFTGQGLARNEAVKRTNVALKAEKHPWANHATVSDVLRASGRFKKAKTGKRV